MLRGAVYRKDTDALEMLLGAEDLVDRLQPAGSGVLVPLAERVGAGEAAASVSARLRERGWTGDEELADEIDAASMGRSRAVPPVAVDVSELTHLLDGGVADREALLDLAGNSRCGRRRS